MTSRPRIVILGAGFAGLTAARKLERLAGSSLEIVLVDRHLVRLDLAELPLERSDAFERPREPGLLGSGR